MYKSTKGLRVGNYRITPLGLIVLSVILLIIIVAVVLVILDPFSGPDPATTVNANATILATASPTPGIDGEAAGGEDPADATPTPSPTPEPEPRSATIRSLGEIAVQTNLLRAALVDNSYDFSEMFSEIADIMGDADYTVADVEGTLGDTVSYTGSGATLITPSSLITALQDCGVDMLMLANDHALDGGFAEQQATIQNCVSAGMDYVGAAASAEEKNTPVIVDINGINVAFVAYTESLNGNEDGADAAATEYGVNLVSNSNAIEDISAARQAGADVVIAYVSWGEMFNRSVTDTQKRIAQVLVRAGADVIIGYNPHVVQPAAWLELQNEDGTTQRTLCLGATGNFLSDRTEQYQDSGLIFEFTIQETESGDFEITNPVYIPTYVWRNEVSEGSYEYRTLAVGEWLETQPDGMAYSDVTRMRQVWAEVQSIMGTEVATVSAN